MWIMPLLVAATLNGQATLELKSHVETDAAIIRLGDVATCADPKVGAAIGQLDIAEFGQNDSVVVGRHLIQIRLQLAGYTPSTARVTGATTCVIKRIQPQPIRERVIELLAQRYAGAFEVEVAKVRVKLTNTPRVADDDLLSDISVSFNKELRLGAQSCTLTSTSRAGKQRTQHLLHMVELEHRVPSLRRRLQEGAVVQASDCSWSVEFISDNNRLLDERDVVGKVIKTAAAEGTPLQSKMLGAPSEVRVIKSRSSVKCIAKLGALRVTLPNAIALDDGAIGDSIRLKNPSSGKEFIGVIVEAGRVHVLEP